MIQTFKAYLNQNYEKIKQECLKSGKLFEDDTFPADSSSLGIFKTFDVEWKRPKEFCEKNPQFIVDKIEPNDLDQGTIGDCWLISAAAVVASVPEYINIVVPSDQSFDENYAGIFRFRFWRFGEWIEVVVDDRLPVDYNNSIAFCHNSKDTNEMFAPLLEKAYAKLNTCYEFLDGGDPCDAMIDFTGGVHERFNIKSSSKDDEKTITKNKLWEIIFKSFTLKSLCGASINVTDGKAQEHVEANGLVLGHAYCILEAFELLEKNGEYNELRRTIEEGSQSNSVKLLKMRNPWGEEKSFTGRWNNKSNEWNKVSAEIKSGLEFNDQTDGQFYICLDDFMKFFDDLDMVHVNMNAFTSSNQNSFNVKWITKQFSGFWKKGLNAGGCGNEAYEDFWLNPQFFFSLKLENEHDKKVSIIISLMQTEQNIKRAASNGSYENSNDAINFVIFKVLNNIGKKKRYDFDELEEVYSHHTYICQREITSKIDLDPGDFVIIPSIYEKDFENKFLLRLFIEGQESKDINFRAYDLNKKKKPKPQNDQDIIKNDKHNEVENHEEEQLEQEYNVEEEIYDKGNHEEENYIQEEEYLQKNNEELNYDENNQEEYSQEQEYQETENEPERKIDRKDKKKRNENDNINENYKDKNKKNKDERWKDWRKNGDKHNKNRDKKDKHHKKKHYEDDYEKEEDEYYEDEYEEYKVKQIPEDLKKNRKTYHRQNVISDILDPRGQVISRACLVM